MTRTCVAQVEAKHGAGQGPCGRETVDPRSPYCYWHRLARTTYPGQEQAARARLAKAEATPGYEYRARVPAEEWPAGERWCAGCQSFVPLWYCSGTRCKACVRAKRGETRRKEVYGIDEAAWRAILDLQGHRCAICRNRSRDRAPAVEHDHGTGAVRGACCKQCNHDLLGGAHDSPRRLAAALVYLLAPPTSGRWVKPEDCAEEILALVTGYIDSRQDQDGEDGQREGQRSETPQTALGEQEA